MTPSFLASFLSFALAGYITLRSSTFAANSTVHYFIMVTVLLNALYFYYLNATAEFSNALHPYTPGLFDWSLTVLQYTLVYTMWFWMNLSWHIFGLTLIAIYSTYLLWDYVHRRELKSDKKKLWMLFFDTGGLLLAITMLIFTWHLPPFNQIAQMETGVAVTSICLLFMIKSIGGIFYASRAFGYNPFHILTNETAATQATLEDVANAIQASEEAK